MGGSDIHTRVAEVGFSGAEMEVCAASVRSPEIARLIQENGGTYKAAKTAVYQYIYGGHFSVAKTRGMPKDAAVTQEKS